MQIAIKAFIKPYKPFFLIGLIFFVSLFSCSCSFRKKALDNISRQYQYLDSFKLLDGNDQDTRQISWKEAKALLIKNNLNLQRTRRQVQQAQDRRKKYWRNYIPGLQGAASLNKRLVELDDLSLDNISFSAFMRVRLPNPLTLSGEVEALNLAEYTAKKRYILQERQMSVRLYQIFLRHESVLRQLERMNKPADQELKNSQDILGAIKSSSSKEFSLKNYEDQIENISLSLSKLLDAKGTLLLPKPDTLPDLGYRDSKRDYIKDKEFGKLAIQLLAANLEASRLRMLQVKLQRYPSLNVSASAPQLYSSSSSSNNSFDPEAIALFGGISDGFDWSGREAEQVKFSKEDYLFSIKQAKSQIRNDKNSLINAQKRLVKSTQELSKLYASRKSLAELAKMDLQADSFRQALERIVSLDEQIDRLEFQLRYQELEFWVWDDKKW